MALWHVLLVPIPYKDRSLSIRTTNAIFHNAILKCSRTEILEIWYAKSWNKDFLMALVCELEKVRTVCEWRFILMHVFGRINVEWSNLSILASRVVFFLLNFGEKVSLILVSKENYLWNHFDTVKAFKYFAKKGKFHQKLCPLFSGIIFLCGRI